MFWRPFPRHSALSDYPALLSSDFPCWTLEGAVNKTFEELERLVVNIAFHQ